MKIVATYTKPEDAHLARARLEGSGVPAFIRDEYTASVYWLYSNAIGGVRVEVADDDVERAREVLALPAMKKGVLACPHCGSSEIRLRELGFWAALAIAFGMVLPIRPRKVDCRACRKSFAISDGLVAEDVGIPGGGT